MLMLLGVLVVASVALIAYSLWPSKEDEANVIKRRMKGKRAQDSVAALREQAKDSVTTKLLEKVAPIATRPRPMLS